MSQVMCLIGLWVSENQCEPRRCTNLNLGCVKAYYVTPPHTVASIKRYIRKVESIPDQSVFDLYMDSQSREPLNDDELVPIMTGTGPGSDPREPLALVITVQAPIAKPSSIMAEADPISGKGSPATSNTSQIFLTRLDPKTSRFKKFWPFAKNKDTPAAQAQLHDPVPTYALREPERFSRRAEAKTTGG